MISKLSYLILVIQNLIWFMLSKYRKNIWGLIQKKCLLLYFFGPQPQRQMFMVWQERLNLPASIPLHLVAMWQMAAEGHTDKMASDMEVPMKQRGGTEFLHAEKKKMTSIGIQWYSPNVYQDQTVDVRTVRQWTVRFSSDNSSMKDKPHSRWPCTAVTP